MKFFVFMLGILLVACQQQQPATQSVISDDDEETLRYLKEVEWPKAYREQDTVLLDRILGDDFQMVSAGGEWSNKELELAHIKENVPSYDSFFFEIKRLDVHENGTAVVAGTGHIFRDSTKMIYQSSNILIKRDGIWKAIASHVSGIKEVEASTEDL